MILRGKNITKSFILLLIIFAKLVYANDLSKEKMMFSPTDAKKASWVFVGMVESETGEIYNYFFQVQRNEDDFRAIVALFDFQTKKLLLEEDSSIKIENPQNFKWVIGRAFLRFNPITNSWVFGLKNKDKQGFNFKVGMLTQPEDKPTTQYLHKGIPFVVTQFGQLNGHIRVDREVKEQFVTAKNTWFSQIVLTNLKEQQHLNGLLCSFNDVRALYAMQLLEASSLLDTVAGLFDADGMAKRVSQFLKIKQNEDDSWSIMVSVPKLNLKLTDIYKNKDTILGFIASNSDLGFCVLSREMNN